MTKIILIECEHGSKEQIQDIEQLTSFLHQHGTCTIRLSVDD